VIKHDTREGCNFLPMLKQIRLCAGFCVLDHVQYIGREHKAPANLDSLLEAHVSLVEEEVLVKRIQEFREKIRPLPSSKITYIIRRRQGANN